MTGLDFGELNLTSQDDDILDEAAGHIQENLEDELVQVALKKASTPGGGLVVVMVTSTGRGSKAVF